MLSDTAAPTSGPSGITFLVCSDQGSTISVYNVDPTAASPTPTEIGSWDISNVQLAFGCNGLGAPTSDGFLERQQFNSDYSELAVEDNGVAATMTPDGTVTDVGPGGTSGYGSQSPAEQNPLFQPGSSQIWYADANEHGELFSVDPEGAGEVIDAGQAAPSSCDVNGCTPTASFAFSPDGLIALTGVVPDDGFGGPLMAPGNKYGVAPGSEAFTTFDEQQAQIADGKARTKSLPISSSELNGCHPQVFISPTTMICDNGGPNLYQVTFNSSFTKFSSQGLEANARVKDFGAVLSPDGSQVAFLSEDNGALAIYSDDASGGNPTEVAGITDLGNGLGGAVLLGWG